MSDHEWNRPRHLFAWGVFALLAVIVASVAISAFLFATRPAPVAGTYYPYFFFPFPLFFFVGMGLPRKILAIPRRILQHHPRTIRQRRDNQRTIRTDDARPTTTQLRPIDPQMGLSSSIPHQLAIPVLLCS